MKNINKTIFTYLFLAVGLLFTSCETTELDLLDDPNNVTSDKASLDRYLNQIQLDFNSFMRQMGSNGGQLTRINYMFGRQYDNNFQPVFMDGEWSLAYAGMFSDMKAARSIAMAEEQNKHLGVMNIMQAYTLITLVDFFGDVPYSQATNPTEFPAPMVDPGEEVYAAALDMLDEGINYLNQDGDPLENDFFYDNDYSKWIKLANTVKMVAYLNLGDYGSFNALTNGPHISSTADDFEFRYGVNVQNPDTRHPGYSSDYAQNGVGTYKANWIMDKMLRLEDPRIRYYFFRQNDCTPGGLGINGEACPPDQVTLNCSVAPFPPHYLGDMIFCSVDEGYWGRDHGNGEGIPPDQAKRTANGVYPVGGRFDGNEFEATSLGQGGGGAGVNPIMLGAWVDMMKAEVLLAQGNVSGAKDKLTEAVTKHCNKVVSFGSLDPTANSEYFATAGDISAYANAVGTAFQNSGDKMEILGEQTFIAHFGNGIDTYNFYRRTGYPKRVQYPVDPSPGSFVNSFYYPANEANTNSNITQKPNVSVQVFWDEGSPTPAAN